MKSLLSIPILLWSLNLFAGGNRVGNGGDVVACADKKELLDLYESSEKIKSYAGTDTYKEIIESVLKNMDRMSPVQGRSYRKRAAEFIENTEFKSDVSLINIKDSKHLFLPKDNSCHLLQIAIRRETAGGSLKRFIIDQDLWKGLNERSKAALILHEVIYEHFYKLGEEDSIKARAVNAYLFSEKAHVDSADIYWKMIKDLKLPVYR